MSPVTPAQWQIDRRLRQKIQQHESEVRNWDRLIEQASHIPDERRREVEVTRLRNLRSFAESRLKNLKRNGHPF